MLTTVSMVASSEASSGPPDSGVIFSFETLTFASSSRISTPVRASPMHPGSENSLSVRSRTTAESTSRKMSAPIMTGASAARTTTRSVSTLPCTVALVGVTAISACASKVSLLSHTDAWITPGAPATGPSMLLTLSSPPIVAEVALNATVPRPGRTHAPPMACGGSSSAPVSFVASRAISLMPQCGSASSTPRTKYAAALMSVFVVQSTAPALTGGVGCGWTGFKRGESSASEDAISAVRLFETASVSAVHSAPSTTLSRTPRSGP